MAGCAGPSTTPYIERTDELLQTFAGGEYDRAARLASTLAHEADDPKNFAGGKIPRDGLILRLEQGAILRAGGYIELSTEVFERANEILSLVDQAARVRTGEETAALLSNPTALAYRGTQYDRIMVSLYLAMNAIEIGDAELARVYLRQAANRQRYATQQFSGEIQKQEQQFRKSFSNRQDGGDLSGGLERSGLEQSVLGQLPPPPSDLAAYDGYQNPLVEFLSAAVFMAGRADPSRAVASVRRARGLEPNNAYLDALLVDAEAVAGGATPPSMTYVIYEQGLAPFREQFKIDVPLAYFAGNLSSDLGRLGTPGIALPTLQWGADANREVVVQAGGETYGTRRVADVRSIVRSEFEADYSRVLSRTIAGVLLKTAAAYAANKAADEAAEEIGGIGGALTSIGSRIGTSIYQYATNQADQRTWRSLPAEVQIAAFPTPADGIVQVAGATVELEVGEQPADAYFIFVRQPTAYARPTVRAAALSN